MLTNFFLLPHPTQRNCDILLYWYVLSQAISLPSFCCRGSSYPLHPAATAIYVFLTSAPPTLQPPSGHLGQELVDGLVLALLTLPKLPTSVTQLYLKFVCAQYILRRGVRNSISNKGQIIRFGFLYGEIILGGVSYHVFKDF